MQHRVISRGHFGFKHLNAVSGRDFRQLAQQDGSQSSSLKIIGNSESHFRPMLINPGIEGMAHYTLFRPAQSQALLARFRAWINTHTDQVIIVGSLIIGFWLVANSIYLIVTETGG